jgi:hypothetical protein
MAFVMILPTTVLTDRFKGSGFNLLNSEESPRVCYCFSIAYMEACGGKRLNPL